MSNENGLSTKKWGPGAWIILHSSAQRYPINPTDKEKECYKGFYSNLKFTLPCGKCKESYTEFLKMLPIDYFLGSRELLTFWIYTVHNFVNFKLKGQGIKIYEIPTFEEVYRKYENFSKF